jgi:membrane protein YdbS with pleckstrin-like domain
MDQQDERALADNGGALDPAARPGPPPSDPAPAASGPPRPDLDDLTSGPQRLDPRIVRVWLAQGALGTAFPTLALAVADAVPRVAGADLPWPPGLPALVVLIVGGLLAWRLPAAMYEHWSYQLAEDALELRHGVLQRVHSAIPYWRVQYIDVQQGPIERAIGLARLVVHTAAASTDAEIPGIDADRAEALRRLLLTRAGTGDAV